MLQGTAIFPGITSIVEASISFVHGISPSIATLVIKPQLGFIGTGGTLAFHFGDTTIEFPDCKVDYNSLQRNPRGEIWRLSIFDRRWKWKWGGVAGLANIPEDDGTIKTKLEATPHQLAEACFAEVNESGYSLAGLPNDPRPGIQWNWDVPMEALARLCDDLGCRIVLGLDNQVRILKVGEGAQLPNDGILENSLTIDPPERPIVAGIVTGKIRFGVDFELEAIGEDLTGDVKLLDDLSYKPTTGWGDDLNFFGQVLEDYGVLAQNLAIKTVYRWYRIKLPADIPFADTVDDMERLGIEHEQPGGVPAWVYGVWFGNFNDEDTNSATIITPPSDIVAAERDRQIHPGPFTIDSKRGIVKFSQAVSRNTAVAGVAQVYAAAILRLRTACSVRNKDDFAWERYLLDRNLGGNIDTPTRWVKHPEIVYTVCPKYKNKFNYVLGWDNEERMQAECNYYLDAIEQQYQQTLPQTITYAGLRRIELDGAIQQIIFNVGSSGATTTVARNTEVLHRTLPFRERRRIENIRGLERIDRDLHITDKLDQLEGLV